MPELEEEYELDANIYYKEKVHINVNDMVDLKATLSIFGYDVDDRIERRDVVNIYRSVEREMEKEIASLAHHGHYSAAKLMRSRLTKLRYDFDEILVRGEKIIRHDQLILFDKAKTKHYTNIKESQNSLESNDNEIILDLTDDMKLTHKIEWQKLNKKISKIPRPRMMYSKRAIELMKAEHELIRLCQYDDAEKVRLMLNKLLPVEKKNFYKDFDDRIEKMRIDLREKQKIDETKLGEKTKIISWNGIRKREKEEKREKNRLHHHREDMKHMHTMESMRKPEMNINPTALWVVRPGYATTAASRRGQQFSDLVNGKKQGQQVFAQTLVDRHTFEENSLQDTITISQGPQSNY